MLLSVRLKDFFSNNSPEPIYVYNVFFFYQPIQSKYPLNEFLVRNLQFI